MISGFWIRVFVSLPIVFLPLVLAGPAGGQTADFGLFVPADDPGLPAASLIPPARGRPVDDGLTVRSRRVFADPAAFGALSDALDTGGEATAVRLNLFPGVVAESIVEWADLTAAGYSWGGGVAGDPFGSAAMAVNGDVVRGVVRTGGREYEIRRDGGGVLTIREVGRLRLPTPDRGVLPGRAPRSVDRSPFVDPADRLDLAVFYSPGAAQIEGGRAGLRALVDSWVADVNAAYKRSGIDQVLTLVYLGPAPYTVTDADVSFENKCDSFKNRCDWTVPCRNTLISTGLPVHLFPALSAAFRTAACCLGDEDDPRRPPGEAPGCASLDPSPQGPLDRRVVPSGSAASSR